MSTGLRIALQRARVRHGTDLPFLGEIEVYCQHADCPIRTVTLYTKERDSPTPAALHCPACKKPLKLHHVHTLDEVERECARDARWSVASQMYSRDHPSPDGFGVVPGTVFLDDRLPPTPEGWWGKP
jgi:hypothetical protein